MGFVYRFVVSLLVGLVGFALMPLAGFAQSEDSDLAPDYRPPAAVEPLAVPDLSDAWLASLKQENRYITARFGLNIFVDYTAFSQDANSVAQVGVQEDQAELRGLRFTARGTLRFFFNWDYYVSLAYKGFGQVDDADDWDFNDVVLSHKLGGPFGILALGKMKESHVMEIVGSAPTFAAQERILNPFFVSRDWGVKYSDVVLDQRATWAVGVYNDWLVDGADFSTSGTQGSARVTWLPRWRDNGKSYLHLAISTRYNAGDNNTLRFRGKPGSNVASYFVDTGNLTSDHAWQVGFEAIWNQGPVSVLAEYVRGWVSSSASHDPELSGYYLVGSWVLTGETRPYDRNVGFTRRILPTKRWGAPELVARFSHVDLDDGAVSGGTMDKIYFGVNWWATKRWKAGVEWGRIWLNRFGYEGRTDMVLTRLQWVY